VTAFAGEVHPLAEVWPMLPDDDLAALAESISRNGLQERSAGPDHHRHHRAVAP